MPSKPEKVRMAVAFGDMSGFTQFCDSITNDEIEYDPFMAKYDALINQAKKETGYSFENTGDGFMCTMELSASGDNSERAVLFLLRLWALLQEILRLIEEKDWPKPTGYRIVKTAGYATRTLEPSGQIILRGKHLNQAHNFLDPARHKGLVCDDSFKHLINDRDAKKQRIKFVNFEEPLKRLWVVKVGGR